MLPAGAVQKIRVEVLLTSEGTHELRDYRLQWKCSRLGLSGSHQGNPLFINVSPLPNGS